jgi:hypothetical protein
VGYRDIGGERRGGGESRSLFSISLFFQCKFNIFFLKNVFTKKVSEIVISHTPPLPPPSPTPWAKEGDSYDHGRGFGYDHGRGFIVRILGGQKRETVMTMVRIS